MSNEWHVLIVDDDADVHMVTSLALKRKTWRGRPIVLKGARSGREAREILQASDSPRFHAALVDVVMETNDAGLQLCDFIRSNMPRTMRIVLRTGQPGSAPPDKVLNDYDIDYYLAKTEVTEDRLFAVLRACFRSALDISTLLAVQIQLRAFTKALQESSTTREQLVTIMKESLPFLEAKYGATIAFVDDTRRPSDSLPGVSAPVLASAIASAHKQKLASFALHPGPTLGLPEGTFVVPTASLDGAGDDKGVGERLKRWFQNVMSEAPSEAPEVGVALLLPSGTPARVLREFTQDLELLLANWSLADSSLRLQEQLLRGRLEMLKHVGAK
jgi:CheY-like chemotaxis protein